MGTGLLMSGDSSLSVRRLSQSDVIFAQLLAGEHSLCAVPRAVSEKSELFKWHARCPIGERRKLFERVLLTDSSYSSIGFSSLGLIRSGRVGSHARPLKILHKEKALKMIKRFLQDETGAELAEYAVGVALLVAIGIVVYQVLGNAVNTSNSTTGSRITGAKYPNP